MTEMYPSTFKPAATYTAEESYRTLVTEFDSGAEQRRYTRRFPKRNFYNNYRNTALANRNTIRDFFKARKGAYEAFWFVDFDTRHWKDEYVGQVVFNDCTAAFAYDDGLTSYTNETTQSRDTVTNDMTLMGSSTTIRVSNQYWFGGSDLFTWIKINIGTATTGTFTTIWMQAHTTGYTESTVYDPTSGFKSTGEYNIFVNPTWQWVPTTVPGATAYWTLFGISAVSSASTNPSLGTNVKVANTFFDLHSINTSTSDLVIYIDGVATTSFTFYGGTSWGGGAGADRIVLTTGSVVTDGSLITADFTGQLRIKGRFKDDIFREDMDIVKYSNFQTVIQEVQW